MIFFGERDGYSKICIFASMVTSSSLENISSSHIFTKSEFYQQNIGLHGLALDLYSLCKQMLKLELKWTCLGGALLLQEIDGKALLLLRSDVMMKYMGLKLGPALKLAFHIDRLKQGR